ncbi:MAG: U32 family peptidase [Saccharofermentans sp.]|nr:U32 family peptidase [Saccharofermentans sp.]
MKMIELLAPAGSLDILKAAVDAGADAVYCGVSVFNARMNAGNFSMEDLAEGCIYAHRRSSRVYLTLNTLITDDEMDSAIELALDSYNVGVDGILVQDMGLAVALHDKYPEIPLHASTQMNVYSSDDYKRLSELGFKRVVLPRELNVKEIKNRTKVAARYGIETEVFAHGAICVCTSGLCLFSSMNKSGTRSGNRGLCAQPCRQEYSIRSENGSYEFKKGHVLSPKDRSIIFNLEDIIESGTASLKIEGRMRDANYVRATVAAYRALIDAYYEGTLTSEMKDIVKKDLLVNFNRGGDFTSHFLNGSTPEGFLSGEFVGKFGLKIGEIAGTDRKKGTIAIRLKKDVPEPSRGDYLSIREKNVEICSFPIGKVHEAPGSITVKGLHPDQIAKLHANIPVYLMSHDFLGNDYPVRKTHITVSIDTSDESVITANAKVNGGIFAECFAEETIDLDSSFEGKTVPLDRIEQQFRKTGNTPFEVDEVYFTSDKEPSCPISVINDLRRTLMDSISSEIDYAASHTTSGVFDMFGDDEEVEANEVSGDVKILHMFAKVNNIHGSLRRDADIYGFTLFDLLSKKIRNRIVDFINDSGAEVALVLPDFMHDSMKPTIEFLRELKDLFGDKFTMIIDSDVNADFDSSIYKEIGVKHIISAGGNLFNSNSLKNAFTVADGGQISYEVTTDEAYNMLSKANKSGSTVLVHAGGMIPWMQSEFCPIGGETEKCRICLENDRFILRQGEGEKECQIVTRLCSSVIYGPSKNNFTQEEADSIADLGYEVIMCYTEI